MPQRREKKKSWCIQVHVVNSNLYFVGTTKVVGTARDFMVHSSVPYKEISVDCFKGYFFLFFFVNILQH